MQTFLPYADFAASAAVLDDRRLGKQRVETFQVLRALTWPSYGWKHHPAVRMWRGFSVALVSYGVVVCDAWEARGYADTVREQLLRFAAEVPGWSQLRDEGRLPPWIGSAAVHDSHRSALVRKEPEIYRPLFPDVPDDLPYHWPRPAFPTWPVRRGRLEPLTLADALGVLGLSEPRPDQQVAVDALATGRSATLALPVGGGGRTAGLLGGLCTAGTTVWVVPGPGPRPAPTRAARKPRPAAARERPLGRVSASVAREPSVADIEAMEREANARPEFFFVRAGQLARVAERVGAGLVVVEPGTGRVPPTGLPTLRLQVVASD